MVTLVTKLSSKKQANMNKNSSIRIITLLLLETHTAKRHYKPSSHMRRSRLIRNCSI